VGDENVGVARVTLQTLADRVGVSRMTVSNAFSRPDQLSAELRQTILAAADELGYIGPDPAARALARGTSGAIGVLLTDTLQYAFTDEVAISLLAAITAELAPTGLALTLLTSTEHGDLFPARDVPMDGALVYSCETASTSAEWLKKRKLPLVLIDQAEVAGYSSVNIDDRGGARAAADHLVGLGHRRIAIVNSVLDAPIGLIAAAEIMHGNHTANARMLGWLDVLGPAGVDPIVLNAGRTSQEGGFEAAHTLLDVTGAERPTAVLCFSDAIAAGVMAHAEARGVRVPADLSVVGFDDASLATRTRPPLTTVYQDVAAKGRAAAAALTAAIDRARRGSPARARHLVLPTSLVVRESTAAPLRTRRT
jgi:DNA-binding LacI/PurR family transcriptional regulator